METYSFKAPTGDTTASRVKTLVLYLERTKGAGEATEFLADVGVSRELIHDETRPVSVAMWRRALEQFALRCGPGAITATTSEVLHPSNLGPWMHVLRHAAAPGDAYRLLDGSSTQLNSTSRIETIAVGPTFWHGRLHVLHDPSLERGGLLAAARRAELAAVPRLFGLGEARVSELASPELGDGFYEYEARWNDGMFGPKKWLVSVGAAIVSGAAGALAYGPVGAVATLVGGVALAVVMVRFYEADRIGRVEVAAQSMRIRALERNLELQEHPAPTSLGDLANAVIAGMYRLETRLGAGATGVIYEATRLSDDARVAVKLLRAAVAEDSVASDRLRREAEALRLTWHSNVVELFDHGHLPDGSSYIVMELLRGETLAIRLAREKRLATDVLIPIVQQICDALTAVHAAGVIHRDLKPSNVYLCDDRADAIAGESRVSNDRVKLFDFGIARVEWAETRITNTGVPLGTPGYMAPEQEGGETIDHRVDIYALGALVFEALTGDPPPLRGGVLAGADPSRKTSERAAAEAPFIDAPWLALIERAMAHAPEDRFADARAFAAAVQAISIAPRPSGTMPKAKMLAEFDPPASSPRGS